MDRFLTERRFVALAFLAFAILTLWTTLHHEAWMDEADVWLVMRDGDAAAIFGQTAYGYRGTPLLWYLAVWPFAAVGAPYLAQQLLNLSFIWIAAWLVLRLAPFPRFIRALIVFSYYFAFEYSVLARPYGLLLLLMIAAAALWPVRHERPLAIAAVVFFMANTSVHGLIIGAALGAALLYESLDAGMVRRRAAAFALMLGGGLLSVAQLWPRSGGQLNGLLYRVEWSTIGYALASAAFPDLRVAAATVPAVIVFALTAIALGRRAAPWIVFIGSIVPLLFVFVFVWIGGLRHAGLLFLLMVMVLWIAAASGPLRMEKPLWTVLAAALVWSVWIGWEHSLGETRFAYSGSREAASYLERDGLEGKTIVAHPPWVCMPVLVYLPGTRFWSAASRRERSYVVWSAEGIRENELRIETVVQRARQRFRDGEWILLTARELPPSVRAGFRLRHRTEQPNWMKRDESYSIYDPLPLP